MKKIINFFCLFFFIYITIQVFNNNLLIRKCVYDALNIWYYQLLPNLFPMFILSSFLLNYGFAYYLTLIFKKPFFYLFKISSIGVYIFFMSMITGFPSSAKYIKDSYDEKLISSEEATKLLTFTHFASPLFILGFISNIIGFKLALFTLIIHYSTNILIGLLFRNMSSLNSSKIVVKNRPFGIVLKNSIETAFDTLFLILGTIIFFMIINTIFNNSLLPSLLKYIVNLFLEMTNAINYIKGFKYNFLLITMILSFGGLCVHFQVIRIISGSKIKYQPYLLARFIHALLAGMLVFIIQMLM